MKTRAYLYPPRVVSIVLMFVLSSPASAQQATTLHPLQPIDAMTAIFEAFQSYPIVALGEGPHGNEQGHAFRLALLRDPRFIETVNDIVVECGSGRYQALMDRFTNGADVPETALRHAWQDTTVETSACDRPIYEEFFRAVRTLNAGLPRLRRIRVLLGDAPIDWSRVRTREDVHWWGVRKGPHAVHLIETEVLAKHRRALIIWGDGWLQGRGTAERVFINMLDGPGRQRRVFNITSALWTMEPFVAMEPDAQSWPVPSLARIAGTAVGARPLATFFQLPPSPGWNLLRMEDEFDAMLYLGRRESLTISKLPPSLCADKAYVQMRLKRLALSVPQARQGFTDAFRRACSLPPYNQ